MVCALAATPNQLDALDGALIQFRHVVLQTAAASRAAEQAESPHAIAAHGMTGSAGALPHLDTIQRSFGHHDIGHVRTYTDDAAQASAMHLGAHAFATGDAVVLGASGRDLHTVAHEAAHVVQQRGGVALSGGVGQRGDRYEQHADAVADLVVAGRSAESLLDTMASGAGASASAVQLAADEDTDEEGERQKGTARLLKLAARARRPGRDAKFDAFQFVYVMLEHWIPEAGQPYVVDGVGYEEDEPSIRLERNTEAKTPHVTVVVGKEFVASTTADTLGDRAVTLRKRFQALSGSVAGTLDEKAPGMELNGFELSVHLAAGALKDDSVMYSIVVPNGGARARVQVTPDALKVAISPHIFVDVAGPINATFHGFTYRFGRGGAGYAELLPGRDIQKSGLGGPLADLAVEKGCAFVGKLVNRMMAGTLFAAPHFNPMQASMEELEGGRDAIEANYNAWAAEQSDGEAEKDDEGSEGSEGYGLDNITQLGGAVSITYKPGYSVDQAGMGIEVAPGTTFTVSVSTSGDAQSIKDKKLGGAKLDTVGIGIGEDIKVFYAGHHLASVGGVTLRDGAWIDVDVALNPAEDIIKTLRCEHPNWFTVGLDETLEIVDAVLYPFVLLGWGLGDIESNLGASVPRGEAPDDSVRKAVTQCVVEYLMGIVEYEASIFLRNAIRNNVDLVRAYKVEPKELLGFLGIPPHPEKTFLQEMAKNAGLGKSLYEAAKQMATAVSEQVKKVQEAVAVIREATAPAAEAVESLQETVDGIKADVASLRDFIASLGDDIEGVRKELEELKEGIDDLKEGAKAVGEMGSGLADAVGELAEFGEALSDLL